MRFSSVHAPLPSLLLNGANKCSSHASDEASNPRQSSLNNSGKIGMNHQNARTQLGRHMLCVHLVHPESVLQPAIEPQPRACPNSEHSTGQECI